MTRDISPGEAVERILLGGVLLDVRSEVEFLKSSLPNTLLAPLLSTEERHAVGISYRECGQEAAVALGHRLVSGAIKQARIEAWIQGISSGSACALFCARGGLRSEISQRWLSELGIEIPRVIGGYKALRNWCLQTLETTAVELPIAVIGGRTGSRKTVLLSELSSSGKSSDRKMIDFEALAAHRGSAFGAMESPQPSQASFENGLAFEVARARGRRGPVFVEDESRRIGMRAIPEKIFARMSHAPLLVISAPLEARAREIQRLYVDPYLQSSVELEQLLLERLARISRTLGGERFHEAQSRMKKAFLSQSTEDHLEWITYLLHEYYDPLYDKHLSKKSDRILFQGSYSEVREFCLSRTLDNFCLPNSER